MFVPIIELFLAIDYDFCSTMDIVKKKTENSSPLETPIWSTGAQFNGRADGFMRVDFALPVADQ